VTSRRACGKNRYPTRLDAERAMRTIRRLNTDPGRTPPCAVYLCHDCDGWHLTSQAHGDDEFERAKSRAARLGTRPSKHADRKRKAKGKA
jgi:hypothetical protein